MTIANRIIVEEGRLGQSRMPLDGGSDSSHQLPFDDEMRAIGLVVSYLPLAPALRIATTSCFSALPVDGLVRNIDKESVGGCRI